MTEGAERYNSAMATPNVRCPKCRTASEYHATIEMLDPPVGKIDIGYCADCGCLFEQVRETGTGYESTAWPPVCRKCRQPVSAVAITGGGADQVVGYQCREHTDERWQWTRDGDRWRRI